MSVLYILNDACRTPPGKNRPLDEDDLAFVTGWQDSEHAKEQSLKIAERDEVASFQEVRSGHYRASGLAEAVGASDLESMRGLPMDGPHRLPDLNLGSLSTSQCNTKS